MDLQGSSLIQVLPGGYDTPCKCEISFLEQAIVCQT